MENPTRRATKVQLGRSLGLVLRTRRQSASPSQASQSACGSSGGGGGPLRLRAGVCLGERVGEGVSELTDAGGGLRTRGIGGGESQEEVGDGSGGGGKGPSRPPPLRERIYKVGKCFFIRTSPVLLFHAHTCLLIACLHTHHYTCILTLAYLHLHTLTLLHLH